MANYCMEKINYNPPVVSINKKENQVEYNIFLHAHLSLLNDLISLRNSVKGGSKVDYGKTN